MSSHHLNFESSPTVQIAGDDANGSEFTYCGMAQKSEPDWYLQEWAAERGKIQADLARDLNWQKNAAHRIWHGKQPYRRDLLNQVAKWLNVEPFEMLMPPQEALSLRQLRESARAIVQASSSSSVVTTSPDHFLPPAHVKPRPSRRTGTQD